MKNLSQYRRILKFISAAILVIAVTTLYGLVWMHDYNDVLNFSLWNYGNLLVVLLYAALFCMFTRTYGGFRIGFYKTGNVLFSLILSLIVVNIISYIQISLISRQFISVLPIGCLFLVQVMAAMLWSFLVHRMYHALFPPQSLLLVYGERPMFHLMQKVKMREDYFRIKNIVRYDQGIDFIVNLMDQYDGIIIGDIPVHVRNQLFKACFDRDIRTYVVPKLSDIIARSAEEWNIFDSPLLLSRNERFHAEEIFLKRLIDIVFSVVGLIITSPFFLIIACILKLTDGGPVFYKQKRLTINRKEFEIYKFRTMVQDAEPDGKARLAAQTDDRVLPIGRFLRATRLDELPQLINILKGEMSIVGPRPERPELASEIQKSIPEFSYRTKVKAGLTGYAQIYGKYNTTAYDKLKLDLTYIRNFSLGLDLKIMLMTPKIMLLKESAEGVEDFEIMLAHYEAAAAEMDVRS